MTEEEFHNAIEALGLRASTFQHSHRIEFLVDESVNGEWELWLRGHVKWDGCSNWSFRDDVMLHFCSRDQLVDVGTLLALCFDYTSKVLPNWCGD